MTYKFTLPKTKFCVVVWHRNGEKHEQLLTTPGNNSRLKETMLLKHRVGWSEIRAIKAVEAQGLIGQRI